MDDQKRDFNEFCRDWTSTTPEPVNTDEEPHYERVYDYAQPAQSVATPPIKKTNKGVFVFIGLILVLILAAVVLVGVYVVKNGIDDGVTNHTQSIDDMDVNQQATPKVEYEVGEDKILAIPQIVEKVAPSVVGIQTDIGSGSGIIMTANGYILTNAHVVENAQTLKVIDYDNNEYAAQLVGKDAQTDIAVLKVAHDGFTAAEFGDSDALEVGETAVAIGNPTGMELYGTVTSGIVSANNRKINLDGKDITLIQTDASINPGNSGGPLINHFGQVVGMTSVKISSDVYEGLGFAIPINTILPIVEQLKSQGYVSGRPLIGITGQNVDTRTAWYYSIPMGVYVQSVEAASDAAAKGIAIGDVITAVNNKAISSTTELTNQISNFKAGDSVTLTVYRNGQYYQITIILMENK